MNLLFVILAHDDEDSLADLVKNVRRFCPGARVALYNSGSDDQLGSRLDVIKVPRARALGYAHITPFFLDVFEWLIGSRDNFDAIVNLETDMLFFRKGFESFLTCQLADADYIAPNLVRKRDLKTRWRPMRSLRPEFDRWFAFLGFQYWHGSFSPAQVFSRSYVETLLEHPRYAEMRALVDRNQSFTLQEVLFPTLTDFLGLRLAGYPISHTTTNRYRPYQALSGLRRAMSLDDCYFVHPVRRNPSDPVRVLLRKTSAKETGIPNDEVGAC